MPKINIIGAGSSGLIMAEVLSANGMDCDILEKCGEADYVKNIEHNSIYYLHSDNIQKILPIPLKRVEVRKFFFDAKALEFVNVNPDLLSQYAKLHFGMNVSTSADDCGRNEIGYVPEYSLNLLQILYKRNRRKIRFNVEWNVSAHSGVIVNTTPLCSIRHSVVNILADISQIGLTLKSETVRHIKLADNDYDKIIITYYNDMVKRSICYGSDVWFEGKGTIYENFDLTNPILDEQFTVKTITKINEVQRKHILFELTSKRNIYSLGRYATWSYKRIDHVVEDAMDIVKMIRFNNLGG